MTTKPLLIAAEWDAPRGVRAYLTTRIGGASASRFAWFNLGGTGDCAVGQNRRLLRGLLPSDPFWLNQCHGARTVCADRGADRPPRADACYALGAKTVCAVLTADCLAVLLASADGVAAVHAGWRGMAGGVLENAVAALRAQSRAPLAAYLAAAIGRDSYPVGEEVRAALRRDCGDDRGFVRGARGVFFADLKYLACRRLLAAGVERVFVSRYCAYRDADWFYSARRDGDGDGGRNAALIWRE